MKFQGQVEKNNISNFLLLWQREKFLHFAHLLFPVGAVVSWLIFLWLPLIHEYFLNGTEVSIWSEQTFLWLGVVLASYSWYLWQSTDSYFKFFGFGSLLAIRQKFETEIWWALGKSLSLGEKKNVEWSGLEFLQVILASSFGELLLARLHIDQSVALGRLAKLTKKSSHQSNVVAIKFFDWVINWASNKKIHTADVLVWLIEEDQIIKSFWQELNVSKYDLESISIWFNIRQSYLSKAGARALLVRWLFNQNTGIYGWLKYPYLNRFSVDITNLAWQGKIEPHIGRLDNMRAVIEALANKQSVAIVGAQGAGKTIFFHAQADWLLDKAIQARHKSPRLRLVRFQEFNQPIEKYIKQVQKVLAEAVQAREVILVWDNIDTWQAQDKSVQSRLFDILANAIIKHELRVLVTVNPEFWQKYLRSSFLGEVLQPVNLSTLSAEEILAIVLSKVALLEKKYQVFFTLASVKAVLQLVNSYSNNLVSQPAHFIALTEEVAEYVYKQFGKHIQVMASHVAEVISKKMTIPIREIVGGQTALSWIDTLSGSLIGQNEVIEKIIKIMTNRGVSGKYKPLASFLAVGPRGVGKSELARALALGYFGNKGRYIGLEFDAVENFNEVDLAKICQQNPSSVILIKHLEKWPIKFRSYVQNLVQGQSPIDLSSNIIIATSLGDESGVHIIDGFDEVLFFKPLDLSAVREIVTRTIRQYGMNEKLIEQCVERGFNAVTGGHSIKKYIDELRDRI